MQHQRAGEAGVLVKRRSVAVQPQKEHWTRIRLAGSGAHALISAPQLRQGTGTGFGCPNRSRAGFEDA
jgi:hypothetical protein